MRDKDLYQQILGIERPWAVTHVELNRAAKEVVVKVTRDQRVALKCPVCTKRATGYDHRVRRWRHLDTCQFKTILEAEVPRVRCKEHGVHQDSVPWAEEGARFTALFESLVIDWLHEASVSGVASQLCLSWDEVSGIQARAVSRGLARRPKIKATRIGVDETSFQKRHEYVTVVVDQDQSTVIYLADDRDKAALEGFYKELGTEGCAALESVAMDMWPAYIGPTREYVPDADERISFDRFHVAGHLGGAVDKVRRRENH
jgi:transposase